MDAQFRASDSGGGSALQAVGVRRRPIEYTTTLDAQCGWRRTPGRAAQCARHGVTAKCAVHTCRRLRCPTGCRRRAAGGPAVALHFFQKCTRVSVRPCNQQLFLPTLCMPPSVAAAAL